ncbi:MAG: hypothetical protein EA377_06470 [Phycisphaerales bacterium]|nr:MAG: hypothetical protein EA377_06470 [Phycisphaerales bacterium]
MQTQRDRPARYDGPVMVNLAGEIPQSLRTRARWEELGPSRIPSMLVVPDWDASHSVPTVLWMHGRTVNKELDPGRYLRWMRGGFGICAVDLPGHGERFDEVLQQPERTLEVVMQMSNEIDGITEALEAYGLFDLTRLAIGGMSAGGMATIQRLTRPHTFRCATVEATSGSWAHQQHRSMFRHLPAAQLRNLDPMQRLDHWRDIPFLAIHARQDEWIDYNGQVAFIDALRTRSERPEQITLISYDETGAPNEHAGFGRYAADAKNRQLEFLKQWLL